MFIEDKDQILFRIICYREEQLDIVKQSQEMNEINEALLGRIEDLKEIIWQVNCKLKSVREAVQLEKSYCETVGAWTARINKLVIPENYAKTIGR